MITPGYARTMAAYNEVMNRQLYTAAAQLTDAQRKADRGAFWKSIHGTLVHILWGDGQWMSRFGDWPKPPTPIKESAGMIEDFESLRALRIKADADIVVWAAGLDQAWFDQDLVWFSGALQKELRMKRGFLVAHFFNHQTHHRGQAHALLTAQGLKTGDTDLFAIVPVPL
jgi:uncharacterized damage-inducible protein DinB